MVTIVSEMDSTTVVLPGYSATVEAHPACVIGGTKMTATIIQTNNQALQSVDVDGVTVDALRNAREEMDAVLFRTAMSRASASRATASP